jgi:N-hydroxyarylamine O-acetyltransferase
MMNLESYLKRIQYAGPRQPTVETLRALHRAHLLAIPYENLDIHLGRRLTLDMEHIYHKIVEQGRGGWCYEMNGLFAWALRELGFAVTLIGSNVGQPAQGGVDDDLDHLVLLVTLDHPWLADTGFGNAYLDPLPLVEGEHAQGWMRFRLERTADKWYFHNQPHGGAGYGFTLLPRQYRGFASRCHELQTSPQSGFVRTTVCHRFTPDGIATLRGAVLRWSTVHGIREEEITTLEQYGAVLSTVFGLDAALADQLWSGVQARHLRWNVTISEANA